MQISISLHDTSKKLVKISLVLTRLAINMSSRGCFNEEEKTAHGCHWSLLLISKQHSPHAKRLKNTNNLYAKTGTFFENFKINYQSSDGVHSKS